MHYKDGTPAKAGDLVLNAPQHGGIQLVGVLTSGSANPTACNGNVHPVAKRNKSDIGWGPWQPLIGNGDWIVAISECERLVEDEPTSQPESTKEEAPTAA